MSIRVMHWVFQSSRSRGADRLVLLAIADSVNESGAEGWPSMDTIARKAGVARRSVPRCIDSLVELGELERVHRGGRSGPGGRSNSYRVLMRDDDEQGHTVTTNQGHTVTGDEGSLVTTRPQVVTTRPKEVTTRPSIRKNRPNRPVTASRKTTAPDTIEITDAMREWARPLSLIDVDEQTPMFLDFHTSKGSKFVDWNAAWRTWMRNAQKFAQRDRGKGPRQIGSTQGYDPLTFEDA